MITASSLFNALPPFADGNAASIPAAAPAGASAADAFAALLAALEPADLQAVLGAAAAPVNSAPVNSAPVNSSSVNSAPVNSVPAEDAFVVLPDATDGTAPFAPFPILLDAAPIRSTRSLPQQPPIEQPEDDEET